MNSVADAGFDTVTRFRSKIRNAATLSARFLRTATRSMINAVKTFFDPYETQNSNEPSQERQNAPAYLLRYSVRDPLTQLPNRSALIQRLDEAIELSNRSEDARFALMCMDMDRFKTMNESLGHALGDQFLADTADRIQRLAGPNDTVARLGGDKFAIIVAGSGVRDVSDRARELAAEIQTELARPAIVGRREVTASASIGIAVGNPHYRKSEEPLRDAEMAMYRAKELGRARFELFDEELETIARDRLDLEMDLRHALERGEFELHYQPIVSASSGTLSAFEALLRWRHPSRGLIPPAGFLPLLHETSLIIPVGRWVIAEVCRQMGEWQSEFGRVIAMSFNLSAREFTHPGVAGAIERAIAETGVNPSAITVEITEDALVGHGKAVSDAVTALSNTGLKLLIDDFGTGYSSLSYLANLSAHGLKIPRELVSHVDERKQDRAIVEAIIALAHVLGLEVIAEGVENVTQLGQLRDLGCEHIQGYLISRPVDAATAKEMLASGWKFSAVSGVADDTGEQPVTPLSARMRA